jgi:hypothetical protein
MVRIPLLGSGGATLCCRDRLAGQTKVIATARDMALATSARAFTDRRLAVSNSLTGAPDVIEDVDSVVAVDGRIGNDGLAAALRVIASEVHVIGDALSPRRMLHATLDGARLGALTL